MIDLPKGWANAKLSEVITPDGVFADGDWIESKDQDPTGSIRLLQLADIGDGHFVDKSNRFINESTFERLRCTEVVPGDVLIARMPDPLGRACLAPQSVQKRITVVDVAIVRPGVGSAIPSWLMHTINAPQTRGVIDLESTGTTRRRIARGKLALLSLPVPPIPEQQRIAQKVDSLIANINSCRARLDRVPQILKKFRDAVLEAAVSGDLTEEWRHSTKGKSWSRSSVVDLCDTTFDGPFGSNLKSDDYSRSGVRVVRLENIGHLQFRGDLQTFISRSKYKSLGKHSLLKDDVLFSSFVDVEVRVCLIPESLGPAINKADCFCLRIALDKALPQFVAYRLATPDTYADMKAMVRGVTRPRINLSHLKTYEITVPPIPEQVEIVRRLDNLFAIADTLQRRHAAAVTQVGELTPSVLWKAFRGELVPQDPNDEPAGEMLERITLEHKEVEVAPKKNVAIRTGVAAIIEAPDGVQAVGHTEKCTLAPILKKQGRLRPEVLLQRSGLGIDEFYDQLKLEEAKGLLREVRKGKDQIERWIEVVK